MAVTLGDRASAKVPAAHAGTRGNRRGTPPVRMNGIGYYGFLASRVPPQRLLATAARRAVRGAWNRIAPPLTPPRDRLMGALACDGTADLARLLARPRPSRPPWTPEGLRRAFRGLPGELERALARAEDAAAGRLEVYGRTVDVRRPDGGLDWQLDPVHGGRFAGWAPSSALPIAAGLDPKMAWALARGEQWVALACGAVLHPRRGPDLADALSASVRDFTASNPLGHGVHWTSAMEVAIRAWNLVAALWVLSIRRPPEAELAIESAQLLVASGRFVLAHLEDATAIPNNHLATDWLGVLACAEALPEWPEAPRWRALALAGLQRAMAEQVNADGTSFEGSVPYHRFSLELLAGGLILAHGARRGLGGAYARRLHGMFRAARALLARSGDLPQLGDNDSGHVLALRSRGPTEGGYLAALGAAIFHDPALRVPGAPPGDAIEAAWLLGPAALEWLGRARAPRPPRSASFAAAGWHVLRRGSFEAFVSCGPNGQRGLGGHDHNDKLSLELRVDGALAVVDPGMPCYGRDPALRDAFRSTRAHATVVVDGLEQAPLPADRIFALPEAAGARVLELACGGEAERLVGEHRGYLARAGVIHRRELRVSAAGITVLDRLIGAGTHAIELRWPLSATASRLRALDAAETAALARLARMAGLRRAPDPDRAVEVPLGAAGRILLAFVVPPGLEASLGPSLRSPGYGVLVDAVTLVLSGRVACPTALTTLFLHLPPEPEGTRAT
jgi:hypothetical protein